MAQEATPTQTHAGTRLPILNLIFIGHVDVGKSTIGGQILYLIGKIERRTLEKYEKESREKNRESWYLSWALDSNPEEREKGKTSELGVARFDLPGKAVQIIDAPGHKFCVPNMLLGVPQADVAVLVVSARQNEFETGFEKGGQTREHIYLAKASGLAKVCVLVNKMDDPTVNWSRERYEQILSGTQKTLFGLFGRDNVTYIPVSGYRGDNLKDPALDLASSWYSAPTFFQYLEQLEVQRDPQAELFASVIDEARDVGVSYVLVRVEQGILRKTPCKLVPRARKITVTGILRDEEEVEEALPGECVRLRYKEEEEINPGDYITDLAYPYVTDSNRFMAQLSILEAKPLISKGYSAMLHMGARTTQITIGSMYMKGKDEKIKKVKYAKSGSKFVAEIIVCKVIPLEVFQRGKRTGVFIIRDESRTVGFGKVLKIKEPVATL